MAENVAQRPPSRGAILSPRSAWLFPRAVHSRRFRAAWPELPRAIRKTVNISPIAWGLTLGMLGSVLFDAILVFATAEAISRYRPKRTGPSRLNLS